jgi:hypothetical protein
MSDGILPLTVEGRKLTAASYRLPFMKLDVVM